MKGIAAGSSAVVDVALQLVAGDAATPVEVEQDDEDDGDAAASERLQREANHPATAKKTKALIISPLNRIQRLFAATPKVVQQAEDAHSPFSELCCSR